MRLFVFLWAICLSASPAAAQDFSAVKISTQMLSERVHVLFGAGGNIGLFVGDTRTVMIDDQFAALAPRIERAVTAIKDQNIAFLINTHYHGDHTGSNAYFQRKGALIIAHKNVRERLANPQTSGMSGARIPAAAPQTWPVVTFLKASTVHEDGETIRLIHVDHAHTDGDTLIFFEKANIIHMGDTFFHDRWPYVDVSAGGSVTGMIAALSQTLELINSTTQVIPGHGPLTNKAAMLETRDRLADIAAKAKLMRAKGSSKAAFLASDPGAAYPATTKGSSPGWPARFFSAAFDSAAP